MVRNKVITPAKRPETLFVCALAATLAGSLGMACSPAPTEGTPSQTGGVRGNSNTAGSTGSGGDAGGPGAGSGGASGSGGSIISSGGNNGAAGAGGTSVAGGGSGSDARPDDGAAPPVSNPDAGGNGATRAFVYVSGYAAPITIFSLDLATGKLTPAGMATTGTGGEPTSLVFSPNKKVLYAGDEQKDAPMSRVIAYAIDPTTGGLQEINREGTRGAVNAHVGVHPSGKWVLSANYDTDSVTVFPVREDGGLGTAMTPVPACGQSHFILFDSTGKHLFVPCVASNQIAMFTFADGVLTPNQPAMVSASGGPRHLVFSPDERFVYSMAQSTSTVSSFAYDKATGRLTPGQTVPTAPGAGTGGHIAFHPSGKFLYTSSRRGPGLTVFTVNAVTGALAHVADQNDMLSAPWWFSLDPAGQFLIVPNSGSANVVVHKVDQTAGTLQILGAPLTVATRPTYAGILTLP